MSVEHAVYSPSSSHRWFECPGSINLSKGVAYRSSTYADEGTAAHNLAAHCLTKNIDPYDCVGDIVYEINGVKYPVTDEMADAVTAFIELARAFTAIDYKLHIEVRLDLGHLHPGQFGTGDAILYNKKKRHLVCIDFKYGKGVEVFVEDNPQLLSYASGAAKQFGAIKQLTLMVSQPRVAGVTTKQWHVPLERLTQFEGEFISAVAASQIPGAPLIPGTWCRFCPASAICPALRAKAGEIARAEFADVITNGSTVPTIAKLPEPKELSADEIGVILRDADLVEHWIESVRLYALDRALLHQDPPTGWKLVRKNTHRKWLDEAKAADVLTSIFDLPEEDLWQHKLVSPAQAEKMVGKAEAKSLSPLIVKPPGDATLAPNEDRREPLAVDARAEFRDILMQQLRDSIATEVHD